MTIDEWSALLHPHGRAAIFPVRKLRELLADWHTDRQALLARIAAVEAQRAERASVIQWAQFNPDAAPVVHFRDQIPFTAVCGADDVNQMTSTVRNHVTCTRCLEWLAQQEPPLPIRILRDGDGELSPDIWKGRDIIPLEGHHD